MTRTGTATDAIGPEGFDPAGLHAANATYLGPLRLLDGFLFLSCP